jgi:hypothetical protein
MEYLDDVDDVELFVDVDALLLRWLPCDNWWKCRRQASSVFLRWAAMCLYGIFCILVWIKYASFGGLALAT